MKYFGLIGLFLLASCSAKADKQSAPEPKPLARVDFPTYEKRVLPNGLTVYALEYHEQPVVSLRLMITAGADNDPANLPGVAAFTADLLNKGTKTRTATQIAEAIDQVGGSVEAKNSGGDIRITSADGSTMAETSSGSIHLGLVKGKNANAKNSGGSIQIDG